MIMLTYVILGTNILFLWSYFLLILGPAQKRGNLKEPFKIRNTLNWNMEHVTVV